MCGRCRHAINGGFCEAGPELWALLFTLWLSVVVAEGSRVVSPDRLYAPIARVMSGMHPWQGWRRGWCVSAVSL